MGPGPMMGPPVGMGGYAMGPGMGGMGQQGMMMGQGGMMMSQGGMMMPGGQGGMVAPGAGMAGQPMMDGSGMMHPGMVQPGMMQPGMMQPAGDPMGGMAMAPAVGGMMQPGMGAMDPSGGMMQPQVQMGGYGGYAEAPSDPRLAMQAGGDPRLAAAGTNMVAGTNMMPGGEYVADPYAQHVAAPQAPPPQAPPPRPSGGGGRGRPADHKLFVGQVPFEASEGDLQPLFDRLGEVDDLYVLRGDDGRSKGCAFVVYKNPQDAEVAIAELNEVATLPGMGRSRPMVVRFASAPRR
mmetsp:Transcript_21884/g.74382  ORF Transcript_21884/g.74382 Transcript_21884/m.74382 type:complete len:293 (-) Transcript_21884:1246-2124(-)